MADFLYSSLFGELTREVQVRFDAISKLNKKLFDNVLFEKYLSWDSPTIGLDFEAILGKYGITIAAATIGDDSKEPIMGRAGLETLKETVLRHSMTLPMDIKEYRRILQLMDSRLISEAAKKQDLVNTMFGDVKTVVDSVLAKLDYIFLAALSNEGVVTLNEDNNPEGGVRTTIDYNQPSDNIATADTDWIAANAATVDVMEDIQAILDAAQDKVTFSKILCAPSIISYICRTTQMKKMIWGTDKSSKIVTMANLNEYMRENNFPEFEPIRRQVRIQNGPSITTVAPFNAANLVFIPDTDNGKLGVVKNAYANNELRQEPGVSYSNYGRIRVSQWGVGETQNSNGVEFTKAEAFALPVITEMNGIYTLRTLQPASEDA